jgi:predicted TIM-barrel fold metal-dependent hydrolase
LSRNSYAPDYDASYDRLLAMAESNGIGRVVIVQRTFSASTIRISWVP